MGYIYYSKSISLVGNIFGVEKKTLSSSETYQ